MVVVVRTAPENNPWCATYIALTYEPLVSAEAGVVRPYRHATNGRYVGYKRCSSSCSLSFSRLIFLRHGRQKNFDVD